MSLVKSKQRVADHGEVFTPAWMVEAMLNLVKDETERIDSRFLEQACGNGNFLVQILRRKLAAVELKYGKSDFERRHYALLALMCIYGIELLPDNIAECRGKLFLQPRGVDHHVRDTRTRQALQVPHNQRLALHAQQGFGVLVGQRTHAFAATGGQNQGLGAHVA